MRYTNPDFDQIPQQEVERQRELLRPMREAHTQRIVESGLADRVMNVSGIFSDKRDRRPLSANTLLTPIRTHLSYMDADLMNQIRYDARLRIRSPLHAAPDEVGSVLRSSDDNYLIQVRRRESLGRAYGLTTYAAGVLLSYESSSELRLSDGRLPFTGVTREDITLLANQMGELGAFADDHHLTIIDRTTLMEGKGELIAS